MLNHPQERMAKRRRVVDAQAAQVVVSSQAIRLDSQMELLQKSWEK